MLISSDIHAFSEALKELPVVCTSNGHWKTISPFIKKAQAIVGADKYRLMKIAEVFARCLDELEQIPAASSKTRDDLLAYVDAAETIQTALKQTQSKRAELCSQSLKNRVVALQARFQLETMCPAENDLIDKVNALASEWKKNSYVAGKNDLDENDVARLRKIERNGAFVECLAKDADLQDRFFNWVLRDKVDPEPFIEFPATCDRLTRARLSHRIGFYGSTDLKIKNLEVLPGTVRRDLTLPMGGTDVSLLDDRQVVMLEKGYSQTVGQIMETFINRQWEYGNVEYFKGGIRNWNPKKLGPYNPATDKCETIDFTMDSWWEQLPVVEELSKTEVQARYGFSLDEGQWVMAIRAGREQDNDTPVNCHGWMQLAIPVDGKYRLFDFGKYTDEFPRAWYEFIDVTVNTVPAIIAYPDDAAFSSDRRHVWHAVSASPDEGRQLINLIKKDVEEAENKNLPYQFLSDNCVKWAWERINEVVGDEKLPPEVSQMDFNELRPSGIMGKFFSFLRLLPFKLRWLCLTLFVALLGAWKSMRIKRVDGTAERISLLTNLPWRKEGKFFCPSQLFRFN